MASSSAPRDKFRRRWILFLTIFLTIVGMVLTSALGWLALRFNPSREGKAYDARSRTDTKLVQISGGLGPIARLSYDLLFILRRAAPPEICIVFMDEQAGKSLGQSSGSGAWDRSVHAQLLRRLTDGGARAVFLDLVFSDRAPDPVSDDELAAEMKANGNVFIGAQLELSDQPGAVGERVLAPIAPLRRAAAGWGVLAFRPVDTDYGVRFLYTGLETIPTATWRMAEKLGGNLLPEERLQKWWVNYYGGANSFQRIPYDRVLQREGVPEDFFKDKIVFVGAGGRLEMSALGQKKDDFALPSTRIDSQYVQGVDVHATIFRNLYKREWLTKWAPGKEDAFVIAFGVLLGLILPRLRFGPATVLAALGAIGIVLWVRGPLLDQHAWFDWCVPAFIQIPFAHFYATVTRYLLVERRRKRMHRALRGYLSPEMADLIAETEFDLNPGGVEVEVTVMFTDIEGFTGLCERLTPAELSSVLTEYFTRTTAHILATHGTIVKFIGDAVLAVWGAPLPDGQHPLHAAESACQVHTGAGEIFQREDKTIRLNTRVGVHTGYVISGNLGSAQRFDYTVIGDGVNLASRLEGLNKYLGTKILISQTSYDRLQGRFDARCAGRFRVVGKTGYVVVYELIAPISTEPPPPWREHFAGGLAAFQKGDFDLAQTCLAEASRLRGGGGDPVARFYLAQIEQLRKSALPPFWEGVVEPGGK